MSKIEVLDKTDRIFEAFLSTAIKDNAGDYVDPDELMTHMDKLVKRGGFIVDGHSNRVIGKFLNYNKEKQMGSEGVKVKGLIFDDYPADQTVWDGIKDGTLQGLSIGGEAIVKGVREDGSNELGLIALYEGSVVDKPCNEFAIFTKVNRIAKGEVKKPFAGFKDFDDCVAKSQDKDNPEAYCASIMREVEGKSDSVSSKNKNDILGGRDMTKFKKEEEKKPVEEAPKESPQKAPSENTGGEVDKQDDEEEEDVLSDIKTALADLSKRIQKLEEDEPEEEVEEENKAEDEEEDKEDEEEEEVDKQEDEEDEPKLDEEELEKRIQKQVAIQVKKSLKKVSGSRPKLIEKSKKSEGLGLDIALGKAKFDFAKSKRETIQAREEGLRKILGR